MRVRDKRKQQKEQKAQKANDKQKQQQQQQTEAEAKAASKAATPTATATATPTLPATEKVAFDNRIKRKNVLALNEKVAALREYDRQPVYKHVGRMFNCSPDQIKRIVQQKEEILRAWEQRTRRSQDAKTQELKVVRVSMLGKAVYDWIRRMMYYKDFIISDGLIQKMALQFKSFMGLNNFFPHQEWCDKFRATYNIQHNDTKLLKIGYTQSHSVQINDIAKDVMSECTPAAAQQEHEDQDDEEEDGDLSLATISGSSHNDDDDDDDEQDVDVDGGGDLTDEEEQDVKPTISELQQTRVLQPLPQLMRLPQVPPGTSQKVLLATPILPPGAAAAAGGAQTMTIIPLATLAQSITQRPLTAPTTTTTTATPKAGMPPPMLDIKQEIKTEPKDEEEQPQQPQQQQQQEEEKPVEEEAEQEPLVRIKQELDSDGELLDGEEDEEGDNGGRSSVNSLVEILAGNADVEQQYIEQTRALRSLEYATPPMTILPPMPTLTKAPRQSPLPTATPPPPAKRQRHDDNNNGEQSSSTIISCAEARKYLKRLEEFALSRENYRLIGLITRADEVMRELADE